MLPKSDIHPKAHNNAIITLILISSVIMVIISVTTVLQVIIMLGRKTRFAISVA